MHNKFKELNGIEILKAYEIQGNKNRDLLNKIGTVLHVGTVL